MTERNTERLELRVSPAFLARLDEWRRQQPDLPTRSEAMRRLAEAYMPRPVETVTICDGETGQQITVTKLRSSVVEIAGTIESLTSRKIGKDRDWQTAETGPSRSNVVVKNNEP